MATRFTAGRVLADYGIVFVLIVVCAGFSAATLDEQFVEGEPGGSALAEQVLRDHPGGAKVVVVAGTGQTDAAFADAARARLADAGFAVLGVSAGPPSAARAALSGQRPDVIVVSRRAGRWSLFDDLPGKVPGIGTPAVVRPTGYLWPNFLTASNLLNVADQAAIFAVLAAGMTLVVITGGIDLSVGSLVALAAVLAALLIRDQAGGKSASAGAVALCSLAAVAVCGLVGVWTGLVITRFAVPPFIVTLGVLLIARGLAARLSNQQSIADVPDAFGWLGGGTVLGIPNPVVVMLALYAVTHLVLNGTAFGRYVYAVGGNAEAARLAGVRVQAVTVAVYVLSALLAGLGGVMEASRLRSGAPTYGAGYELYVIAGVVVGGTSLSGGQGSVFGTLVGTLLIAVIQNGMNLVGVESSAQQVVLGSIIVSAVLTDRLKHRR